MEKALLKITTLLILSLFCVLTTIIGLKGAFGAIIIIELIIIVLYSRILLNFFNRIEKTL